MTDPRIAELEARVATLAEERDLAQARLAVFLDSADKAYRDVQAKVEAAEREAATLRAELAKTVDGMSNAQRADFHGRRAIEQYQRAAELAVSEAATLREALAFYAEPESYFAIGFLPDRPCGDFIEDFEETELGFKPGKRARAALAGAGRSME